MRPTGSRDKTPRIRGWNQQQISILHKDYYNLTMEELSKKIQKSIRQIQLYARKIGLKKKKRGRKPKSVIIVNKTPLNI